MQYTINSLREEIFQNVYMVYEVFVHQFGEDKVDIHGIPTDNRIQRELINWECEESEGVWEVSQRTFNGIKGFFGNYKPTIYVWWPDVTITNENNRSIRIKDLYAKINVTLDGCIPMENHGFLLNKATYSMVQFESGYIHSHVPSLYINSNGAELIFKEPCLGTGPIRRTILQLKTDNSEVEWMLFCEELDRYVTVESLSGGPYRRLEEVGNLTLLHHYSSDYVKSRVTLGRFSSVGWLKGFLKDFIPYYINRGNIPFSFVNGTFHCGLSYFAYLVDVSNAFIEWTNQSNPSQETIDVIYSKDILRRVYIKEGKFYQKRDRYSSSYSAHPERYEGQSLGFTFKGREVTLHIEPGEYDENHPSLILNSDIANYIIQHILLIINYHYTDEYIINSRGICDSSSQRTEGASSTSSQAVYYI